ncbi:hypothetical protein [Clostridium sp. AM58-1XD]|uniref:hypothetical protein n=1 Tax=Clostridium sp. AM58-1XD TaxID=2292307 RepID=UPI000E4E05EC|nr:hypothetical protein [Clostridium sp. AM58-1XD]RGZ01613.1 hypothetical protein DXA13_01925 [Clostridium sp. AM58-1XD]
MHIEKSGKVKLPHQYRNWEVEICGDSDDTGGFYLIIFHDKEQLLYWDTTEAGILQQIINDDFEIEWFA